MSELEVGQVWKNVEQGTVEILKVYFSANDKQGVLIKPNMAACCSVDSKGNIDIGRASIKWILQQHTLITNADGTPHVKPPVYREVTPMEAMKAIIENDGPINCQLSDDEDWQDVTMTGADLDTNATWPFATSGGSYKKCRVIIS